MLLLSFLFCLTGQLETNTPPSLSYYQFAIRSVDLEGLGLSPIEAEKWVSALPDQVMNRFGVFENEFRKNKRSKNLGGQGLAPSEAAEAALKFTEIQPRPRTLFQAYEMRGEPSRRDLEILKQLKTQDEIGTSEWGIGFSPWGGMGEYYHYRQKAYWFGNKNWPTILDVGVYVDRFPYYNGYPYGYPYGYRYGYGYPWRYR